MFYQPGRRARLGTNAAQKVLGDTPTQDCRSHCRVEFIPVHASISLDGAHAYLTNAASNLASVFDASTDAVRATVRVGLHAFAIARFEHVFECSDLIPVP